MDEIKESEWYWLKEKAKSSFMGVSDNYKQKILYNLLNATKVGNQKRFFDVLLRALTANLENSKDLVGNISNLELKFKNKDFEKSDELRTEINSLGYEVKDGADGQKISKI